MSEVDVLSWNGWWDPPPLWTVGERVAFNAPRFRYWVEVVAVNRADDGAEWVYDFKVLDSEVIGE